MRVAIFAGALIALTACQAPKPAAEPEVCQVTAPEFHQVEGERLSVRDPQLTPMLSARGDLNGDGIEEVAEVVVHQPGGSGSFYYLSVNRGQKCGYQPLASVFLGDRIALDALVIDGGKLWVTFRDRGELEPMISPPTRLNRWRFALEGLQLKRLER